MKTKRYWWMLLVLFASPFMTSAVGAEAKWVHSRDLGMVADNPSLPQKMREQTGKANAEALRQFLKTGTHLILDDQYYVVVPYRRVESGGTPFLVIDKPLHLQGGGIRLKYYGFQVAAGSSVTADGVRFESEGVWSMFWAGGANNQYGSTDSKIRGVVGELRFTGCHFGCPMLRLTFPDLAPKGSKVGKKAPNDYHLLKNADGTPVYMGPDEQTDSLGIRHFVVERCTSTAQGNVFAFGDCRVYKEFRISGCTVTNASGCFIYYGSNNNNSSANAWMQGSCEMIVEDNTFRGCHYSTHRGEYHCPILAETNVIRFRHNVVDNYIARYYTDEKGVKHGNGAYDNYLSCRQVFFENNQITNVFAYRAENTTERKMTAPFCEWGKSKSAPRTGSDLPTVRHFTNNVWRLDDRVVMAHLRGVAYGTDSTAAIITLTDAEKAGKNAREQQAALEKKRQDYIAANYQVSLFHVFDDIDEVVWRDNVLDFGRGTIECMKKVGKSTYAYSAKYGKFIFERNQMSCRNVDGNFLVFAVPEDNPSLKANVRICDNTWKMGDACEFCLVYRTCQEGAKDPGNGLQVRMGDVIVTGNRVVNGAFWLQPGLCEQATVTGNKMDKALPRGKALNLVRANKLTTDVRF